ncbi:MAG TPA: hypothetical protein VF705_07515 [Longimicrobium sp.]|jgi:hypothetical protein
MKPRTGARERFFAAIHRNDARARARVPFRALVAVALLAGAGWAPRATAASCTRLAASPVCPPAGRPILAEDFETEGGPVHARLIEHPRLSVAAGEGTGGGRALRARYVGGPMGSERIVRLVPLPTPGIEYTLNYDVKFDRHFQFVRGGKLHGLGPAHAVAGGNPMRPDGWSARVMWRGDGVAETYTYHQDQQDRYGDRGRAHRRFRFRPGRYHAVSLHVRLNEPVDRANGFARLYVDGELVESRERVRFRAIESEATRITQLLFSTFHGGNDPSWAPRGAAGEYGEVQAYFDNIAVYPGGRIREKPGA